jgi:general secretion pathway protein D
VNQIRTMLQGAVQNQLGSATTYSSDDRTNQVIVISDPRQHPFFDSLIKKLDVKADPTTRNEVIHLKHANAKEVASLLSQLVSGQNQAASKAGQQSVRPNQTGSAAPIVGPVAPGATLAAAGLPANLLEGSNEFSTLVTILPDERSNAVIISGTISDIQLISDLVSKIDILLAQVRIEVVIAEVSSENSDATGINALGLKFEGNKLTGFVTSGPGVAIGGGEVDSSGNPSGFATITRGDGGYSLAGILSLTAHSVKSKVTILANTTLATTHNKKAEIFVGESRPVFGQIQALDTIGTSTSANSAALRSSITQQEAGIKMAITPLIGADGTVQLEIEQTFNAFGLDVPLGDGLQQPSINKREAKSFLNVGDKEIVALGGYQNSTVSKSRSRLGPIPILGDLLGPRSGSVKRTELMVFIRPHVIRTIEDTTADAMAKIQTSSDPTRGAAFPRLADRCARNRIQGRQRGWQALD